MYTSYFSEPSNVVISDSMTAAGVLGVIAIILALVGGILTYFLFVRSNQTPKNKFLVWLKDFLAFKSMWIEPILKISYYVETIFVILGDVGLWPNRSAVSL